MLDDRNFPIKLNPLEQGENQKYRLEGGYLNILGDVSTANFECLLPIFGT